MTTSTRASSMPPRSSPSTSTPPAWAWLEEKYVPVTTDPGYYPANVDEMCRNYTETELSIHSHKPPDSDAFCKRNDSDPTGEDVWPLERAASTTASGAVCTDQCDECRCAPGQPHAPACSGVQSVRETHTKLRVGAPNEHPACDCTAQVTESVINAVPEHPAWVCNDCGQDRYGSPFGVSTWHGGTCDICGETKYVTEPRDFCGYHTLIPTTSPYFDGDSTCTVTAPETTSPADSCVVESCPECGTVTDIEYRATDGLDDNPLLNHMECTFNSCMDIAVAKNEGYAGNADPMANFNDSVRLGVPVPIGVALRLSDKWARLCRLLQTGENPLADEPITDTIMDAINYLAILLYALEVETSTVADKC